VRTTRDALLSGRLRLRQPARGEGYRVNADALLLARFAARGREGRAPARVAIDLGAGVGAVGLALLHDGAAARMVLVEADADLAGLARDNVRDNGFEGAAEVALGDALDVSTQYEGAVDLVVCNPPYAPPGRGRAPAPAIARARVGELDRFVRAARIACRTGGRACFVYAAQEATSLLASLRAVGLEPKRLRAVHPRPEAPARVILVDAAPGRPGGLSVEAPLYEHGFEADTREARALTAGTAPSTPALTARERAVGRARSRTPRAR
jgi:tRNA1Val (adenine37-N6)-methyltransferase